MTNNKIYADIVIAEIDYSKVKGKDAGKAISNMWGTNIKKDEDDDTVEIGEEFR